jgi:uncharacterized protein YecT (DUF1311 family)
MTTSRTKHDKRTTSSSPTSKPARPAADVELNEQFHALLRDAAEKREERALILATEDEAAARRERADLLALARGQGSVDRTRR